MSQVIMFGCDLHDRNMLLRYAVGVNEPQQLSYDNDAGGRRRMIARLKTDAKDAQMLLEQVRRFVLAGNKLAVVWTPPQRHRNASATPPRRPRVGTRSSCG